MKTLFATLTLSLALALAPAHAQNAALFYQRGVRHEQHGDAKAAEQAYRAALESDPGHAPALNDLGVLLEGRGDIAGAAALVAKAAAAAPGDPVVAHNHQRMLRTAEGMELAGEGKMIRRLEFRDQFGNLLPDGGRGERPVRGASDTFAWARIAAGSLQPGTRFARADADEMVVRLMELSWVDDAVLLVEPTADGVNVTVQLTLAPKLGKLGFIGNRLVPSAVLEAALGLQPGERISCAAVTRAELMVEAVYQRVMVLACLHAIEFVANGGLASADLSVLLRQWRRTTSRFRMAALATLDIASLPPDYREFLGRQFVLDCTGIKLEQPGTGSCDLLIQLPDLWSAGQEPLVEVRAAAELLASGSDPRQVLGDAGDLLASRGMLGARLLECRTVDHGASGAKTVVTVDPGPCHTIRRVDFAVTRAWVWEKLKERLPAQPGARFKGRPLNAATIREIDGLLDQVRSPGGVEAEPEARAAGPGIVDVVIAISPAAEQPGGAGAGPCIGRVNIVGNIRTPDRIIRRALPAGIVPGARFDPRQVDKIAPGLGKLGFGNVSVDATRNDDGGNFWDVSISVEE
jgi:hypothetical protein